MKTFFSAVVLAALPFVAFAEQCQHYELAEIKQMSKVALVNEFCGYRTTVRMNNISQKQATEMQVLAIKFGKIREEESAKNQYEKLSDQNSACEGESRRIYKAAVDKKVDLKKLLEDCP